MKLRIIALALLCLSFAANAQTPRFLKKELKESPNYIQETDGFVYKWYQYSYLLGEDTVFAAFDINGKRITPNSEWIYKKDHSGYEPRYVGGGIFDMIAKTVNKTDNGEWLVVKGYNTKGVLVFPPSLKASYIYYAGDGLFTLTHHIDGRNAYGNGRTAYSAYNSAGKCIVPDTLEYSHISCYPSHFICDGNNKDFCRTYTPDGKYFAEGYFSSYNGKYDATRWYNLTEPDDLALFEKHKFPASAATKNPIDQSQAIAAHKKAAEQKTSSSTPISSSSNSSSNTKQYDFHFLYFYDVKTDKNKLPRDYDNSENKDKDFCSELSNFVMRYELFESFIKITIIATNLNTGAKITVESHYIYPQQSTLYKTDKGYTIVWGDNGKENNASLWEKQQMLIILDADPNNQKVFKCEASGKVNSLLSTSYNAMNCQGVKIEDQYTSKYSQLVSRLQQYSWKGTKTITD